MDDGDGFIRQLVDFLDRHPLAGYNLYGRQSNDCVWLFRAMTVEDAAYGLSLEAHGVSIKEHDFGPQRPVPNHALVRRVKKYIPLLEDLLVARDVQAAEEIQTSRAEVREELFRHDFALA